MVELKFCMFFLLLICIAAGPAAAHPPSGVTLVYSEQNGEVAMTVNHSVSDPSTHYISEVTIRKNGETVIGEGYTGQPSGDTFTYRYPIILNPGDEIVATAECNIGGSGTARFLMPGQTVPAPSGPDTMPRYLYHAILMVTGILCIIASGLIPVYGKRIAGWYRLHVVTAAIGSILVIPALFLVFRVSYLSVSPSAFTLHVILGILLLVSLLAAIILSLIRNRMGPRKRLVRSAHIWMGRAFIILMVVNVISGLVAVGVL
ncbi:MAG TPA: hypothetical protein PLV96_06015 [Methanoregulaceae archaeon]|nr:hypothetical protein [Methanoregulaceae archaeon]HQA80334.1 hypothetical protein [Methanoregulaceae archaeon]